MPYLDLAGKIAIVTGAAGGIGKALVRAFVREQLRVAALDIDGDGVLSLQNELGRDKVLGLRCDVSDAADCGRQVQAAVQQFGGLHILVNNAALGMNAVHPDYATKALQIEDVSAALWARFMAVNVNGSFYMARAVVPIFRRQRWGRVINVTTSYISMSRPGFSPYGPSKAAIEAWILMLSRELEGTGITANIVLPGGPVDTAMVLDEDRSGLIPPEVMCDPMLGLFTEAGGKVTGQRFIAVEWDAALGTDPAAQPHRSAAWPELAKPWATMPKRK